MVHTTSVLCFFAEVILVTSTHTFTDFSLGTEFPSKSTCPLVAAIMFAYLFVWRTAHSALNGYSTSAASLPYQGMVVSSKVQLIFAAISAKAALLQRSFGSLYGTLAY